MTSVSVETQAMLLSNILLDAYTPLAVFLLHLITNQQGRRH
ncbi:uncharacterized protein CTRU02_213484 [Colletotrichum truncatum]|uniref:Uncharacterized protein n=1 Tax=Colletotrichum truncatum TaxID=5467 RepID=A0ACC3YFY1_COLTU|nr:uncharacterized protein CTRU02_12550 [Colletotrichum truncatum]KAF6784561.1 hypothetical protein CTRU02_12550 [Colletotrichum truncatum]